jgi:hypothetical protein
VKKIAAAGMAALLIAAFLAVARVQPWGPADQGPTAGLAEKALEAGTDAPGSTSRIMESVSGDGPEDPGPESRARRLKAIMERMKGRNCNVKPVLQELTRRLRESPDGKLSREEIRHILPGDMARDFDEIMAVIQSEP